MADENKNFFPDLSGIINRQKEEKQKEEDKMPEAPEPIDETPQMDAQFENSDNTGVNDGIQIPVSDQFALAAELMNLEAKKVDPNIFNKDIPGGNLVVPEVWRMQSNIELTQLCKFYEAEDFIKFLNTERNSISMTSKARNGWLLKTLFSTIIDKSVTKVEPNKSPVPQQQQQQSGGLFNFRR